MKFVLALDLGTTSVKAGLFDEQGACLATATREYQLLTPQADQAELDAETYWQASVEGVRSVLRQSAVPAAQVAGVAVSSQGETLIAVDPQGRPLRNAIVWMDNRAVQEAEDLKARLGAQVYARTGIPEVVPTWPACKMLWLKRNEPATWQQVGRFLLLQDFIIYRLSGRMVTDGSISCTTMLYDIQTQQWWPPALEAVGITPRLLPEILAPGAVAGTLSAAAAAELGLPQTVKVVCGGMDQCVGAIGAGNIDEGTVSETTGAALAMQVSLRQAPADAGGTPVYVHSVPGRYLLVPVCPTAGMAYKWFKDHFIPAETPDPYDYMNDLAEKVPAGCDGLTMLPHLMGAFSPASNPAARGSFTGFTLSHGVGHFARAIQEAVAFLLRQNLDAIEALGLHIAEVRTSGGASRSRLWNQIKADVCARPIRRLQNPDTGLVGDAILAGVACGLFPSIEHGCRLFVHLEEQFQPSAGTLQYDAFYRRYLALDENLKDYFIKQFSA